MIREPRQKNPSTLLHNFIVIRQRQESRCRKLTLRVEYPPPPIPPMDGKRTYQAQRHFTGATERVVSRCCSITAAPQQVPS
jgi:hypothetical protein